jgi:hypothetical protein
MLKITGGTTTLSAPAPDGEITAFGGENGANIEFSGGTITGNDNQQFGIEVDGPGGSVKVLGGTIDIPNGFAVNTGWGKDATPVKLDIDLTGNPVIKGIVVENDGEEQGDEGAEGDLKIQILGNTSITQPLDLTSAKSLEMTITSDVTLTITETGRLTLTANGILTNNGTLTIDGTVTNMDRIINNGIINVNSGPTPDNQGTLTNKGTINIAATGRLKNTGTIDNTDGTINNDKGGVFESVQTAYEMGGKVNGTVTPISDGDGGGDENEDEDNGGCNAGFGLFGLLPLAVCVARKRVTA